MAWAIRVAAPVPPPLPRARQVRVQGFWVDHFLLADARFRASSHLYSFPSLPVRSSVLYVTTYCLHVKVITCSICGEVNVRSGTTRRAHHKKRMGVESGPGKSGDDAAGRQTSKQAGMPMDRDRFVYACLASCGRCECPWLIGLEPGGCLVECLHFYRELGLGG